MIIKARPKPMSGEMRSDLITSCALFQLGVTLPSRYQSAIPIPRIAPIRAWELDDGSPSHHTLKFQIIAASKSERTIQIPKATDWVAIKSNGNKWNYSHGYSNTSKHNSEKIHNCRKEHGFFWTQWICINNRSNRIRRCRSFHLRIQTHIQAVGRKRGEWGFRYRFKT